GISTWEQEGVSNDASCQSGTTAMINFYAYQQEGDSDDLLSPFIDLTGVNTPLLTFDYAYARYSFSNYDRMMVQIREVCSDEWTTLWDKQNNDLATASQHNNNFVPTCSEWSAEEIDLT